MRKAATHDSNDEQKLLYQTTRTLGIKQGDVRLRLCEMIGWPVSSFGGSGEVPQSKRNLLLMLKSQVALVVDTSALVTV